MATVVVVVDGDAAADVVVVGSETAVAETADSGRSSLVR